ncbi:MAG: hypothetical protein ACOX3L_02765 [Lutisporaceae bacterium]|jgi:hypothetical protein
MPSFSVNGANLLNNVVMEISAEKYYNEFEYWYSAYYVINRRKLKCRKFMSF